MPLAAQDTKKYRLISTAEISNDATVDFAVDLGFDDYEFEFIHVLAANDGGNIYLYVSTDNGATWTTRFDESIHYVNTSGGVSQTRNINNSYTQLSNSMGNVGSENGLCGRVEIFAPDDATRYKRIWGRGSWYDSAACCVTFNVTSAPRTNSAITNVRFVHSGGNLSSGIIYQRGRNR